MGVIWTPQQRTTQPQNNVGINRANSLTRNLKIAWTGSLPKVNAVTQATTIELINAPTQVPTGHGIGVVLNGSNQSINLNAKLGSASGSWYALAVDASSLIGSAGVLSQSTDDAGGGISIGTYQGYVKAGGSQAYLFDSGTTESFKSVGGTWNASATKAFNLGVLKDSAGAGSPTDPAGNYFAHLGAFHYSGGRLFHWAGTPVVFFYWDRTLSDAEMAQLHRNPWQVFAPDIRPKVFYVAGGGGSTVTGVGSSDGVGTVSGVGASTSAQVGSSSGVGVASGVGASTANSVGSSSGTGAADGVGSSTGGSDGVGASTGTGTASGIGASTAASTGSSDGVGAGSGVGASTAASVGSASGTGIASGVGTNGSIVSTGVGSAFGTSTATGISPTVSRGGGKTTGNNLSRKQKKKLKAVESQEWLKAEETARQLLSDRFTKQTPQEKAQALETYIESLQPVIEALKALTSQIEEVVEEAPVIELTPHQEVIQRFDRLEKKVKSVEELIIILMADL